MSDEITVTTYENGKPIDNFYKYSFGRKVIEIPLSRESVNEITIQKYLPQILADHAYNAGKIRHFKKVYRGRSHIFNKERLLGETKKNTIINENHAYYMVEFKKGYMFGHPIQFSCVDEANEDYTAEISTLNRYLKDEGKASKDIELGEAVYKCGNAYRMVLPKPISAGRNLEKESPFRITNLDGETTFVVYSQNFTHEKLFGGVITTIDSADPLDTQYEIMIYTQNKVYRYACYSLNPSMWDMIDYIGQSDHYLKHIPIVEYYTNTARLGIIDILETLFDAINDVSSDAVDNINDFVNSVLAIYNMEIDETTKEDIDRNKAIALKTLDPSRPADAKYLTNALNQADVMQKYDALVKVAYNIAGVPLPTQKNTSGGDTGEARALGGGWESADTIANQNEEPLKQGESVCLEIMLDICKLINTPIRNLYKSDIEINFNRTNRDNLMSKTQAMKYLYDMNLPKEAILNMVGITSSPHEVAMSWEQEEEARQQKSFEREQQQKELSEARLLESQETKAIESTEEDDAQ